MNTREIFSPKALGGLQEAPARPTEDAGRPIDLNEHLIRDRSATYFMRVHGEAMKEAGIFSGDVVIVDRALPVRSGSVVIAVLNGEMLIRRLDQQGRKVRLLPATDELAPIDVDPLAEFFVWGTVTYVIHSV